MVAEADGDAKGFSRFDRSITDTIQEKKIQGRRSNGDQPASFIDHQRFTYIVYKTPTRLTAMTRIAGAWASVPRAQDVQARSSGMPAVSGSCMFQVKAVNPFANRPRKLPHTYAYLCWVWCFRVSNTLRHLHTFPNPGQYFLKTCKACFH
jgi:hypothetical protein